MGRLTLSFDNGPEAKVTEYCLDVLAAYDVKTTFFAVGRRLESPANLAALRRAHAEGHWIGNHSYTHATSLGSQPTSLFDDEVERTQALIGEMTHPDKLFRPFFNAGVLDNRIFKKSDLGRLAAGKYSCVFYNCLTGDWADGVGWVDRAMIYVNRLPWTTMILHDILGYPEGYRTGSMLRLGEFLRRVRDEGHEIVQDFDPAQVPVYRGEIRAPIDHLCN
jgi:peptidoglycan/xylan/chitin deacetylase (PgdA/CDA1 family)